MDSCRWSWALMHFWKATGYCRLLNTEVVVWASRTREPPPQLAEVYTVCDEQTYNTNSLVPNSRSFQENQTPLIRNGWPERRLVEADSFGPQRTDRGHSTNGVRAGCFMRRLYGTLEGWGKEGGGQEIACLPLQRGLSRAGVCHKFESLRIDDEFFTTRSWPGRYTSGLNLITRIFCHY